LLLLVELFPVLSGLKGVS